MENNIYILNAYSYNYLLPNLIYYVYVTFLIK